MEDNADGKPMMDRGGKGWKTEIVQAKNWLSRH